MFLSKNMEVKLPLVLGSSSVFRCGQLRRLGIDFQTASPDFDETPIEGEHAGETALRLAEGKARSLAAAFPAALIIGADQVAWYEITFKETFRFICHSEQPLKMCMLHP